MNYVEKKDGKYVQKKTPSPNALIDSKLLKSLSIFHEQERVFLFFLFMISGHCLCGDAINVTLPLHPLAI